MTYLILDVLAELGQLQQMVGAVVDYQDQGADPRTFPFFQLPK